MCTSTGSTVSHWQEMKWIGRSYRNILLQLKNKDSFFYWHMGIRMVQSKYRYTKNTRLYGKASLKWKQVKKDN